MSLSQLKRGPGHYPETPLPGQAGNVSIAGHRTTYGQPFHNVDKLEAGDQILTTTVQGEFVYEVDRLEIVDPGDVEILEDQGDNRMTLIACHRGDAEPWNSPDVLTAIKAAMPGVGDGE